MKHENTYELILRQAQSRWMRYREDWGSAGPHGGHLLSGSEQPGRSDGIFFFLTFVLAAMHGMQDLSSLTMAPAVKYGVSTTGPPGKFQKVTYHLCSIPLYTVLTIGRAP